jgi:hypothetical protein
LFQCRYRIGGPAPQALLRHIAPLCTFIAANRVVVPWRL